MKKFSVFALVLSGLMIPTVTMADYGCQRKLDALEKQLDYAKKYDNKYRVRGLETAIANVKTYCGGGYPIDSPEARSYYEAEQRLELLEKVADAEKDKAKAEYKLQKAKLKGDIEDQYEAEYKIKEAQMRIDMYSGYLDGIK